VIKAFRSVLTDRKLDASFKAEALALPSEITIAEQMDEVDPGAIHAARVFVRRELARACRRELLTAWKDNTVKGAYRPDPVSAGKRSLQGLALGLLMELDSAELQVLAMKQFEAAGNMTERMNALGALMLSASPRRTDALAAFYEQFKGEALVVDKWLALQAGARGAATLGHVRELMRHEAFSMRNPNKVRSLIGTFCHGNPACFHAPDGSGYAFWADRVVELDHINPQVAARLARAAAQWKKLEPGRRQLLRAALERIAAQPGLSKDSFEIVTKSIA
jgi:aminopeptidase N